MQTISQMGDVFGETPVEGLTREEATQLQLSLESRNPAEQEQLLTEFAEHYGLDVTQLRKQFSPK